jgi:hypothetical protein
MSFFPLPSLSTSSAVTKSEELSNRYDAVTQALQGGLPLQLTLSPHPLLNPVRFLSHLGTSLLTILLPQKQKVDEQFVAAVTSSLNLTSILSIPNKMRPEKTARFSETAQSRTYSKETAPKEIAKIKSVSERLSELSHVTFQKEFTRLLKDEQSLIESLINLVSEGSADEQVKAERLLNAAATIEEALRFLNTLKDTNLGERIIYLADMYATKEFDEYIAALKEFDITYPIKNHLTFIKSAMHHRLEAAVSKLEHALNSEK